MGWRSRVCLVSSLSFLWHFPVCRQILYHCGYCDLIQNLEGRQDILIFSIRRFFVAQGFAGMPSRAEREAAASQRRAARLRNAQEVRRLLLEARREVRALRIQRRIAARSLTALGLALTEPSSDEEP